MFEPKNTALDVATFLISGLKEGSIILDRSDTMMERQTVAASGYEVNSGEVYERCPTPEVNDDSFESLKEHVERLTLIQAQTQAELIDARKVNSRLCAALDEERLARAVLENSNSWRIAKAFREILKSHSR